MKHIIFILLFSLAVITVQAQDRVIFEQGTVSYLSSRSVYVKFNSTQNIKPGDTLFIQQDQQLTPALVVNQKSSSSTVCTPLGTIQLQVKDVVVLRIITPAKPVEEAAPSLEEEAVTAILTVPNDPVRKPLEDSPVEDILFKEKIKGRVSVASYSNFSDYKNTHRMRYAFSFRGYNLNNSRFSTESYVTFRHQLNDSIKLADALKVYALSVKYDFNKNTSLNFGRKINPKFSSMGAIDGLQFEKGMGPFSFGLVAGSRPDLQDYGFNLDLLQFGGYASLSSTDPSKYAQTTLGFIEQMNTNKTDRRFIYFQHSSTLAKHLNLFGSFEMDLFEKINEQVNNSAQLTNLYLSLRYRVGRKLRLSASYDNRKNIIYYESYKSFIDQLIEDETRQGFRFGFNYRPFKTISWGVNSSLRLQKSKENASRNLSSYLNFSSVPFIKARATLRANFLQTDFIDSQIFGIRFSKPLIRNKVECRNLLSMGRL